MGNQNSTPSCHSTAFFVAATLLVAEVMTRVTGSYVHWPFIILGIIVGLMAVQSINR